MKLILLIFLLFATRCVDNNNKPYNYDCVILESTAENNKPIPILIFRDTLIHINNYIGRNTTNALIFEKSTIYLKEYLDKFIFTIQKKIVNEIGECSNKYSDSSYLVNSHPLYSVRLISHEHESIKYVNTEKQLKNLFDGLESILKANNLLDAFAEVDRLRKPLPV